jgi:PEP-CTERM motif
MKQKFLAALQLIGALTVSTNAHAGTVNWSLGGGGVSASGTFTIAADPNSGSAFGTSANLVPSGPGYVGIADPLSASLITGVTNGVFSDALLHITNEAITGIYANNYAPHFAPDPTIPYSFSYYTPMDPTVSYDNLFYVNGSSPQTCSIPSPPSALPPGNYGGYFDNYGVMLTLANGDYVDLYSNGDIQATQQGFVPVTLPPYGVVVIQNSVPDYTSAGGLAFATPEPSTWAMMALGFAALGFAGYRTSRNAASNAG